MILKNILSHCKQKQKKAMCFLDHMIKPSVTCCGIDSFDTLLNVMEDSECLGVKELAKQIRSASVNKQITP